MLMGGAGMGAGSQPPSGYTGTDATVMPGRPRRHDGAAGAAAGPGRATLTRRMENPAGRPVGGALAPIHLSIGAKAPPTGLPAGLLAESCLAPCRTAT